MNDKKILLGVLICFCLFSSLIGEHGIVETKHHINSISVKENAQNTKILLTTNTPLPEPQTYFSPAFPSTIVLFWKNVHIQQPLPLFPSESPLIKKIDTEPAGNDGARLFIHLNERIPYRILSGPNQTVIECNHVSRASGAKYFLDPDTDKAFSESPKTDIFLEKMEVEEKNDRIEVKAKLSNKAIPNIFYLKNPPRLVIDLLNTHYLASTTAFPLHSGSIEKVRVAQFQESDPHTIARIVFDLKEPQFYTTISKNDSLMVSFPKSHSMPLALPAVAPSSQQTKSDSIESPKASGKARQDSTSPSENKPEDSDNDAAISTTKGYPPASSSRGQTKTLTVPEMPKVKTKHDGPNGNKTSPALIQSQPAQTTEPQTIQEEKTEQTQLPTPPAKKRDIAPEKPSSEYEELPHFTMDLIFKDADLRDVVISICEEADLNVVFDPEVRGTVTCNWKDVPWTQALDLILKQNKMGKTIEGNVLRVAPVGVLTREQEDEKKLKESQESTAPLIHKPFELSYARATEVEPLLRTKKSGRGEIIIDERTNTLIISDVQERMDLFEQMITVLDTATPQVSIQARIVEANSTFTRNLGIQWGFRGIADPFYGNQTSLQFPNNLTVDGALIPTGITTKGIGGPLGGYAINLPAPSFTTALGLSFGNVLDTFRLDVALSALETSGNGKIISCPSVTTQNNSQAEILQGRQIPVQTVQNFTVTTRYQNAALELRATPQITAEGTVIMDIEIRNNAADFANLVNGIPPITMQSARTRVMVEDGGTTVIGGIYRTEDSITRDGVPFLHKIPILGGLFRSFSRLKQNRELLIFITPRIIRR
ncbi:MAG: type IV pilus secretin PilQ [Candidatus Aminicenantes bacterium]|nr:type IV pilus secretin PilQ [Candidatus Aminicenantes bacterium]